MFIGDARRKLFISGTHEWNGVVRDITASVETEGEQVNMEEVEEKIKDFYIAKAHWAIFKMAIA
jgi:hypothetical protein